MRTQTRVLAIKEPDPRIRDDLASRLRDAGFARVKHTSGWLLAVTPVGYVPPGAGAPADHGSVQRIDSDNVLPARSLEAAAVSSLDALERLPGDESFLLLRPDGDIVAVRSVAGPVPIYLWQDGERLATATRLGDLLEFVVDEPRLNPFANALFCATKVMPRHDSFFEGVQRLPPGFCAGAGREWRVQRYWNPSRIGAVRPSRASILEHSDRLRDGLLRNLDQGLDTRGGLLTLSGGVDSSALLALAAGTLGRRVSTLTFVCRHPNVARRDLKYVDAITASCANRIEHRWHFELTIDFNHELLANAPLVATHVVHPALCLLPKFAQQKGLTTYFGGEFADAMFGSLASLGDWMSVTLPTDLLANPAAIPYALRRARGWAKTRTHASLFGPRLPAAHSLPALFSSELSAEYTDWRETQREQLTGRRPFLSYRLQQLGPLFEMNWEVTSLLGVRRLFPFVSRDLLELALETHPVETIGPGGKNLTRIALRGLVPRVNLQRPDKGLAGAPRQDIWRDWTEDLPAELVGIVRPDWLPRPPRLLPEDTVLHLRELVNIVLAVRNRGQTRHHRD